MKNNVCENPVCHNYREDNAILCDECLKAFANSISEDEIYEIYLEVIDELKRTASSTEDRRLLADLPNIKDNLFNCVNELLLLRGK